MLSNAYFLAKISADTAENEQHFAEILPKIGNYPTGSCQLPDRRPAGSAPAPARQEVRAAAGWRALPMTAALLDRANLTGLVLGCIEAKFCKKICV